MARQFAGVSRAVRGIPGAGLRLRVVGDGGLLPAIRRESRDDPRIGYLGWFDSNRVAERYRSRRALVVGSLWHEVTYTVVCGAQSRSVVATRGGGTGDLIGGGVSGVLSPPGDVPVMRGAIVRIPDDDGLSAAMGRAGFELVREYGRQPVLPLAIPMD